MLIDEGPEAHQIIALRLIRSGSDFAMFPRHWLNGPARWDDRTSLNDPHGSRIFILSLGCDHCCAQRMNTSISSNPGGRSH